MGMYCSETLFFLRHTIPPCTHRKHGSQTPDGKRRAKTVTDDRAVYFLYEFEAFSILSMEK